MALARNAQKQRNPGAAQPPAADGAATDSATTNDGAANDGTAGGGSGGATNDGGNDLNDGATTADAADADPAASAEAKTPPKMVERPQLISSDEPHQLNDPRINNPEADDDAGRTKGRAMDAAMEDRVPAIPDRADGADNEADADTQKVADQVMHESEQPRAAVAANNDERDGDDRNDPDTGAGAAAGDDADADNDTDASARADGEAPASGADEGDVPEREESSAVRALANALPPKRARPQILDEEEGRDGLMAGLQSRKASDLRGSPAGHSSAGQRHPGHPGRPGRHHRFAARGLVPAPIAALLPFKLEEGDTKDPEAALNKAPVFGDKGLISDPAVIDASTPNAAPNEGMDVSGTAAPTAGSAAPAAAAPKAKRSMLDGLPGFLGFFRTTETQEIKNLTATEAAAPPEAFDDPKFAEPTELEIEEPKLKANATRDVLAGGDLIPPRANAVAKAPPKRLSRRGLPIPNPLDLLAGFFGSKRQEDEAAAAPNGGGGGGENGAEVPNSAESEPVSPPNAVSNGTAKPALSNMTETDAASREPAGGPMTTSIGPFRPDLASALALPLPLPLGSPAADAASGGHGHGGDHGQGHEAPRNDGHDGAFNGTATPVASQKQTASQPLDWKAVRAAADQLPVTTSTPEGEAEPSESVERGPATTRPGESADHGREGAHGGPDAAEAADGGADRHRAGPSSREGRSTSGPAASGPTDLPSDVDDAGLTPGNRTASDTAWAEADEAFDGQVLDDDRDDREVGTASDAGEPGGPADAPEGSHPHREPEPGAGAGAELEAEPATAPDAARPRASAWSPDMLSETERRAQLPGAAGSAPEARLAAPDRERAGRAAAVPHATKNSQNLGRRQRRAIGNGLPFVMKRVRNTLTNAPDQPGIFDIPDIDPAEIPSDKPSQANEPTSMGFRPPSPFGGAKKPLTH
ncbi:hypothetical protein CAUPRSCDRAFT_11185 [Caulochytrium protostelioides]|uniref:Uncharacterized protein n=1 Tax=Caulochytrium protostelioides TaxID=1555241 RepID=A0A4P9WV00_9FUNG|nr:hypothetical protein CAUPRSCDRAFT_11185 [Caulochytrium protostelioides]